MEPGAVFRPTYKALHREFASKRNRCERGIASLQNQHGVYADELRRCLAMYERMIAAMEEDRP
jgi:hypothetical protein